MAEQCRWWLFFLPCIASTSLYARQAPGNITRSLVMAQFDVLTDSNMLLVPVRVGDKDCRFWVDIDASRTVLDGSLKHVLGQKVAKTTLGTSNSSLDTELFAVPPLQVGDIESRHAGPWLAYRWCCACCPPPRETLR